MISQRYLNRINSVDFPIISLFLTYSQYSSSKIKAIISDKHFSKYKIMNASKDLLEQGEILDDIFIDFENLEFLDQEKFIRKLDVNQSIYISEYSAPDILPQDPSLYNLFYINQLEELDSGEFYDPIEREKYYSIELREEDNSISGALKNSFKYEFDYDKNKYVPITNERKIILNYSKPRIQFKTIDEIGNHFERFADYGNLIKFILSKLDLTVEEREILSIFLKTSPSLDKLQNISKRENRLINLIENIINA